MTFHNCWQLTYPDNKVHGANMRPIWGRQDPGGPHVGLMNFAIWVVLFINDSIWSLICTIWYLFWLGNVWKWGLFVIPIILAECRYSIAIKRYLWPMELFTINVPILYFRPMWFTWRLRNDRRWLTAFTRSCYESLEPDCYQTLNIGRVIELTLVRATLASVRFTFISPANRWPLERAAAIVNELF